MRSTFPDAGALEADKDIFFLPVSRQVVLLPANRNAVSSSWQRGRGGGSEASEPQASGRGCPGQALSQGGDCPQRQGQKTKSIPGDVTTAWPPQLLSGPQCPSL